MITAVRVGDTLFRDLLVTTEPGPVYSTGTALVRTGAVDA